MKNYENSKIHLTGKIHCGTHQQKNIQKEVCMTDHQGHVINPAMTAKGLPVLLSCTHQIMMPLILNYENLANVLETIFVSNSHVMMSKNCQKKL